MMAENFITGMQQGVQAGNELIYGGERQKQQNVLLSQKAQEQGMLLEKQKQDYTSSLAVNARLRTIAQGDLEGKYKTDEGALQMIDIAMKSSENPEEIAMLRKRKQGLQEGMDNTKLNHEKVRLAQQSENYDIVRSALSQGPEGASALYKLSETTGKPEFGQLAGVLEGKAFMPNSKKKYSEATPDERLQFEATIRRAMAPAKDNTAHQIEMERNARERTSQQIELATIRATKTAQTLAKAQQRSDARAKAIALETRQYNLSIDTLESAIGVLENTEPEVPRKVQKTIMGYPYEITEKIPNPLIATKRNQIERLTISHNEFLKRMQVEEEKSGFPGEQETPVVAEINAETAWINRAKASNPGMSEEAIIAEGKKRGIIKGETQATPTEATPVETSKAPVKTVKAAPADEAIAKRIKTLVKQISYFSGKTDATSKKVLLKAKADLEKYQQTFPEYIASLTK